MRSRLSPSGTPRTRGPLSVMAGIIGSGFYRDKARPTLRAGDAALHRRPLADLLEPTLEIFELVDVLSLRLPIDGPGITDHVGDRVLVAGDIAALIKAVVENAIEPVGFIGKAADRIG